MEVRICSKCKSEKNVSEYHKSGIKDGKQRYADKCKICRSEYEKRGLRGSLRPVNPNDVIVIKDLEWEIWREIEGYEGLFEISNYGRVKSLSTCRYPYCHSLVTPYDTKRGYKKVSLYKNKKPRPTCMHTLMAKAFIPNPENKPEVNHKDGDKKNYSLVNLEWSTRSENIKHALNIGLMKPMRGSLHKRSKLTEDQVVEIINSTLSKHELSKKYGVCYRHIASLQQGRIWKHVQTKEYTPIKRKNKKAA